MYKGIRGSTQGEKKLISPWKKTVIAEILVSSVRFIKTSMLLLPAKRRLASKGKILFAW